MKCIYCHKELPATPEGSAAHFCPYCGKPQSQGKSRTTESVIREIAENFGPDVLRDKDRLVSFFADLAPEMSREKNLLKAFTGCGGNIALLDAKDLPEPDRKVVTEQTIQKMHDNLFIDRAAAQAICTAYLAALSVPVKPDTVHEAPAVKFSVPKASAPEPAPASCAASKPAVSADAPAYKAASRVEPARPAVRAEVPHNRAAEKIQPVSPADPAGSASEPAQAGAPRPMSSDYKAAPAAKAAARNPTGSEKLWAFLSYINALFALIAVSKAEKAKSEFLLLHAVQGMKLWLICALSSFMAGLNMNVTPVPSIILLVVFAVPATILRFAGLGFSMSGKAKKLPLVWKMSQQMYEKRRAEF